MQIMLLNMEAAAKGAGLAAVKVARAYLKQLASELPLDVAAARKYFEMAVASFNPDGHYGLATLWVAAAAANDDTLTDGGKKLTQVCGSLSPSAFKGLDLRV